MSHFAEINSENIVQRVLVADQDYIDSGAVGDANNWIQTSYDTHGGVHYAPNSHTPDGGIALRKNYAGIGYTYDATRDAFYEPQPFASWTLDDDTCLWNAPVAYPDDGKMYSWDEDNTEWVEVE
jgi:hypothetical protein|tara:strand:- start:73 stop:444 length:372 start_codon:yes stop_codon:yes gene_type:complete